ncbi:hypothetical protein [Thermospira aquatica]|uniref:Peptidase C39-like domain-containing protein n=1 Tax=Thermospira aquatica TaxID=2828656 RepID=A0AAX3BEG7_9SPIR|nr:hypothetical protein [Thermospira aquatica]URA10616.1 hypothetical protein KDW03_02085 [Thermospira aquatica]
MAFTKCYSISNGQWQWDSYDWNNLLKSTTMGFASGFVAGWVGGELGGRYTDGNLSFIDRISSEALTNNVSLFYEMKLNNFANTIGSIAGEAVHYAWGGNFRISLASDVGIGFTHEGQIVNDTSGGIGLVNLVDAIGSLNYVGFQYKNVHGGDEGLSRISYVNMAMLSRDKAAAEVVMKVINGEMNVTFDLDDENHYGQSEGNTIRLNKDALKLDGGSAEKIAFYASVLAREGFLGGTALAGNDRLIAYIRELGASGMQTRVLEGIRENVGIDLYKNDSEYSSVSKLLAYAVSSGDLSDFEWESGSDLKIKYTNAEGKEIDIEYINQKYNKSYGIKGDGSKGALGGVMCNETSLAMALVEMGINVKDVYNGKSGGKLSLVKGAKREDMTAADYIEMARQNMYKNDYRGSFATLYKLAVLSGKVEPYVKGGKDFWSWFYKNTDDPALKDKEKEYDLNKVIGEIQGIYGTNSHSMELIKTHYKELWNYMGDKDKVLLLGSFRRLKWDGTVHYMGHIVKLLEVRDDGIVVQDPFGEYEEPDAEGWKYNINSRDKEYDKKGVYFLNWEAVQKIQLGKAYLYIKEYTLKEKLEDFWKKISNFRAKEGGKKK